jgi:hypothetical protein
MDDLMTALKADLGRAKGLWPRIAQDTGIGYFTVCRIAGGKTPSPQIGTFLKLRGWLDANLDKATN